MNVRSYEYLIAIAEKGTLSGAAKLLGVSQPTLSNFLSSLEKQLGHTLFERGSRILLPTEAGQIYLEACRKIVNIKSQTYRAISDLTMRHKESFSIGISPHRGSERFSEIYFAFYQHYPDIHIDVKEGYMTKLMEDVKNGKLTMAIGSMIPDEQDIFGFSVHDREELLLAVPLYHPLASLGSETGPGYPTADIRRFQDTPFIMWGENTTNYQIINRFFKQNGISPVILYESDNVLFLDKMLQNGLGIGFLTAPYCSPGQGRVYFSFDPPLYTMVGTFFRRDTELTPAQRYFLYLSVKHHLDLNAREDLWLNETSQSLIAEFEKE